MIVGTAGHIDHGKTTLVRALTGVDTDRLKEEKARGLTIELGYAYAPLENGDVLAFIDVPGHERLVHTMAAGASGIDFGLLVIAADDGVMPQTREHLAILSLLGIQHGAIALTKSDRADGARRHALRSDIANLVRGSFLAGAPVFELNASAWLAGGDGSPPGAGDPSGVAALRAYLVERACAASQFSDAAAGRNPATRTPFRLAIDRVFTLKGHGTVVTGTVHSGALYLADDTVDIRLMPAGSPVRIRSIHAQNRPSDAALSGQRCALNLAGVDKDAMSRGDWIADARCFTPSRHVDAWLRLLAHDDDPIRTWAPVHVQLGAAHCTAHVVPLSREHLPCGETGFVQLVFDRPVCTMPGDRFIVRSAQADRTIGGGVVLDPDAPDRKRRSPQRLAWLDAVHTLKTEGGLQALFEQAVHGLDEAAVLRLTGRQVHDLPQDVMQVPLSGCGTLAIRKSHWEALAIQACKALETFHARQPDEPGVDGARLRRMAVPTLSPRVWQALQDDLLARGRLRRRGAWLSLPTHHADLTPDETALARILLERADAGAFDPPWVRDHAREIGAGEEDVRRLMRKLLRRGELVQVVRDLFYHPGRISSLAAMIHAGAQAQGITAADFRDLTGLGRKRAIQILEFFDRTGYTRRLRDAHVLRKDGAASWQQVS